ncbi:PP2C family serine/threonine-protein phosphatase [Streptomyces sp. WMMB 322]|uniref:PP2C family protein-serine/threonine phosphatase n=1 Tax=Streptomyces sp. WMMB 322 TaxID=1286821 RepID=UPI0006E36845|nr:PP2C family serine/threonine-protein phosphatase [Streptomyces sp. WMMB 322]
MLDQLSACPRCSEPLAAGERFCGVCGADLGAARPGSGTGGAPGGVRPVAPGGWAGDMPPGMPPRPPGEPDFTLAPADNPVPGARPGYAGPGVRGRLDVQGPPVPGPQGDGPSVQGPPLPAPPAVPASSTHEQPPPGTPDGPVAPPQPSAPPAQPPVVPPHPSAPPHPSPPAAPDPRAADPRLTLDDSPHDGPSPHTTEPAGTPAAAASARCVACGTGAVDGDGYCDHCGHQQPRERDHMEGALPSVAAASDRGLRHHRNEDFFSLHETATPSGAPVTIAVVCDGVSSATRPDDASAAAALAAGASMSEAVPRGTPAQQAMHDALVAASEAVTALAAEGPNEPSKNAPACTIVGALTAEGILTVGWIGDSRAYWVPEAHGAPPARLTEDDSWAAQMVAAGLMTEGEAYADPRAHAITGWLGADAYEVEPHTASYKPEGAGVVIVCTDGVWNYAESAEQMAAAVPADSGARPLQAAQRLVGFALDGGGHDNATVAVIPFPGPS